jgi:hypothetical protein
MSPLSTTSKTASLTIWQYRKQIIANFKRNKTKNELSSEDAAKITGYSLRTLQSWIAKLGQKLPRRKTPIRKTYFDDIREGLIKFIRDEYERGRGHIETNVVIKEAKQLCPKFKGKNPSSKKQQIYRLMKKIKCELPLPPRTPSITQKKYACIGEGCENECRKKDNCPHKKIVNGSFKLCKVVDKHGKGKSLVADGNINKGDFIIEYFGKVVPPKVLQKTGGKGIYYLLIGGRTIDGNIPNNNAKYVNHSCKPNCVLQKLVVDEVERPALFAKTSIKRGTELTIDFDWTVKHAQDQTECRCSAGKNCRRWMQRLDVPK